MIVYWSKLSQARQTCPGETGYYSTKCYAVLTDGLIHFERVTVNLHNVRPMPFLPMGREAVDLVL